MTDSVPFSARARSEIPGPSDDREFQRSEIGASGVVAHGLKQGGDCQWTLATRVCLPDPSTVKERIQFVIRVVSKRLPAHGDPAAGGLDLPLLPRIPLASGASAQKERIQLIVRIVGEGFPAGRDLPVGSFDLPLLLLN